ncbi:MAG: patatin-like phospholipase family protein [Planctomycetes bacterium]|nr:patatin-like phospholipase family protein [Planctomycetota bacterium]
MTGALTKEQWLARVLGVNVSRAIDAEPALASGKPVRVAAAVTAVPPPPPPPVGILDREQPRSGRVIAPKLPAEPPVPVRGANGRAMAISRGHDGRVTLIAPPPQVREITFSGGGGKGAALPGAVRALERSGVLKDVTVVTGASVGSMTAALVACGCTAEEFEEIGNDPSIAGKIKEGKNMAEVIFGGGLSGEGLEDLVRMKTGGAMQKRIMEYVETQAVAGEPIDPAVLAIAKKLADGKRGPTFGDLRTLSKVIPAIKEVVVSGSYMGDVDPVTGKVSGRSQLVIFSADTEPELEVAVAVHASASLPPVFKPVDIPLSSGITARFQDGGVLNNAPTTESIGAERNLDPVPERGAMTFVFEEEASQEILNGVAVPRRARLADWLTGAEHSAAEYAKNRGLADRPEDVVMVPLKFEVPARKGKKAKTKDFSGFLSGTVNFGMDLEDKLKLQSLADEATTAHIKKKQEPRAREFSSEEQMLICIPRADLAALAADGFAGARAALEFRDAVTEVVARLVGRAEALSGGSAAAMAEDGAVRRAFAALDELSTGNVDRQGFVAREVNRNPRLDPLLNALRRGGGEAGDAMRASYAVNDALAAKAHCRTVLRDVVYPKMVKEDPKGSGGLVLSQLDATLRSATSPAEVNAALRLAIGHFAKKKDRLGLRGHREFAAELERCLMEVA